MFARGPDVLADTEEQCVYLQFNFESYKLDPETARQLAEALDREAKKATGDD